MIFGEIRSNTQKNVLDMQAGGHSSILEEP
jgi:hypothetical protein